ncbi:MAG: class I SAM-dependent methyltransferase [Pseudorhodoplanes sp.]
MERDASLESEIRRLLAVSGPMPVSQYMALCLSHPRFGYYVTHDPFGKAGDFTTAPEVSQMFGELVGLWTIGIWRLMGSPDAVRLVELGPGRGTMMRDILRTARVMPDYRKALAVHLVEVSPALRAMQEELLAPAGAAVSWHSDLESVPDGPLIIVANEFLDALPVRQAVKQGDGWHERTVEMGEGGFAFGVMAKRLPHFERILPPRVRNAPAGAIYEWRSDNAMFEIARRVVRGRGAALLIDYGHAESDVGETLQAVGGHAFADPLSSPGLVDLTAHVDFQAAAQAAENMGARAHGPVTQRAFLSRLGIAARAEALKAAAPERAGEIDVDLARLIGQGRTDMGELFKVLAIADPKLGLPPGFES